jgi:protocatechuate 3,4-dioxygenase beta subunit
MKKVEREWMSRRKVLGTFGVAVGGLFSACSGSATSPTSPTTTSSGSSTGGTSASSCAVTASETEGPYPDIMGMLNNPAFNRRNVTEGKPGTPLTLALTIVNANTGCGALGGAAVEIWQCDAAGNYSEYSQPGFNGSGQTFLRGVQTTDAAGQVTFNTIYPGWYAGRATHIHVEVYVNGRSVKVTQVAFPENISAVVYASGVYASKGQNTTSNTRDNVFSDGTDTEMATVSGGAGGYTATLRIVI